MAVKETASAKAGLSRFLIRTAARMLCPPHVLHWTPVEFRCVIRLPDLNK